MRVAGNNPKHHDNMNEQVHVLVSCMQWLHTPTWYFRSLVQCDTIMRCTCT